VEELVMSTPDVVSRFGPADRRTCKQYDDGEQQNAS
jgi:hypothetical protein